MFHYRSFRAQTGAVPALRIFADICGLQRIFADLRNVSWEKQRIFATDALISAEVLAYCITVRY